MNLFELRKGLIVNLDAIQYVEKVVYDDYIVYVRDSNFHIDEDDYNRLVDKISRAY